MTTKSVKTVSLIFRILMAGGLPLMARCTMWSNCCTRCMMTPIVHGLGIQTVSLQTISLINPKINAAGLIDAWILSECHLLGMAEF
jgi:hypothetical protein